MRLVFLGSSGMGIPRIGVPPPPDTIHRTTNGLVIQPNGGSTPTLLVDAGPDIRLQWTNWPDAPLRPDAVFVTHCHFDHVGGIPNFFRLEPPMPVYGSADTLARLQAFAASIVPDEVNDLELHVVPDQGAATICDMRVETLALHHTIPVTGLLVRHEGKTLAHLADTNATVEAPVREAISACDLLIVDTPRLRSSDSNIGVYDALTLAREVGAKRLVLTHIQQGVAPNELAAIAAEHRWMTVAHDGMVLDL